MTDVYGAGSQTTGTMITFSVLYMAKFPHVLERVRKEVDDAWTDDDDLQYILAYSTVHIFISHFYFSKIAWLVHP